MKWRLAEITAPDAPAYDPQNPRKYEIDAVWESDVINEFADSVTIPEGVAEVGHWYRARVRMLDDTNRWSHWSDPVEFRAGEPDTLERLKSHLVLSELMYHASEGADFDYLELHNTNDKTLAVGGVAISGGVRFIVPAGMQLAPNQFALVIGNDDVSAFRAHYKLDDATLILGTFVVSWQTTANRSGYSRRPTGQRLSRSSTATMTTGRRPPMATNGRSFRWSPIRKNGSGD